MFVAFAIDVLRLTIWLAVLTAVFVPLESLFARMERLRPRRFWSDLGYFYLNGLAPLALLPLPLAIFAELVTRVTPAGYTEAVAELPFFAKIGLALLVSEIGAYWAHRWCHISPFLWRFHVVHHSVEHVDWLANSRAHPFDLAFVRLCGLVPVYALGLARSSGTAAEQMLPVYVTLFGTFWSFFIHANLRWRFGWLEQLIAMPRFHHWHHTNDENRDRNFAALLPFVDRLFGTLHLPAREWPPVYGVDRPVTGSMLDELAYPFAPNVESTASQPSTRSR
jgi:sterol desaturase/sphingolipid hydroxylase (fatty acid hydroxylase superfamily)